MKPKPTPRDAHVALLDDFDHSDVYDLNEYDSLALAMANASDAVANAELPVNVGRWLTVIRELALAVPFADECTVCRRQNTTRLVPPHAGTLHGNRLTGQYRCPRCGYRWDATFHTGYDRSTED